MQKNGPNNTNLFFQKHNIPKDYNISIHYIPKERVSRIYQKQNIMQKLLEGETLGGLKLWKHFCRGTFLFYLQSVDWNHM